MTDESKSWQGMEMPPGWPLEVAMQQRAEALRTAREVMRKSQFMSASVGAEVDDLIHMARYIIKGKRDWKFKDTKPVTDLPMQELMSIGTPAVLGETEHDHA